MSKVDMKVVLLGSEYVGKTSLLERYVHDRFRGTVPYQNTIGAAYAAKRIETRGKILTMGIWDTAGSERYEAMSRIYYRAAKAAIVCYDIGSRESWDRAKFWISELRSCEENCKIYLCGTKLDVINEGEASRQVEVEKGRYYAEGIQAKFFETSSKTGHNVGTLFQTIADDFLSNPANSKAIKDNITLHNLKKSDSSCCNYA